MGGNFPSGWFACINVSGRVMHDHACDQYDQRSLIHTAALRRERDDPEQRIELHGGGRCEDYPGGIEARIRRWTGRRLREVHRTFREPTTYTQPTQAVRPLLQERRAHAVVWGAAL